MPEVHIYDRDVATPPAYQTAVDGVNARTNGSWAADAIQEVYGIAITFTDACDVPTILSTAVNLAPTNPYYRLGNSRAKRILNEFAVPRTTAVRITAIDTANEINNWLRQIGTRLT